MTTRATIAVALVVYGDSASASLSTTFDSPPPAKKVYQKLMAANANLVAWSS